MKTAISQKPLLSKSTFVRGCKCLKSLHLYKHHYDLKDAVSDSQQAVFDQGHEVGLYAQQLFPGGVDCSVNPAWDYNASLEKTSAALDRGASVLYEAGFQFNKVYAAIDILVIKKSGWFIYEVKSSTEVKDYHYLDAAIQYYILRGLGLPIRAVNVVTINKQYERKGAVDPRDLFTITNVTARVRDLQDDVATKVSLFANTIQSANVPAIDIGPQSQQFYDCDFHSHCWQRFDDVPYPVYTIKRIASDKLWQLIGANILCQTEVPYTFPLSQQQKIQVHGNKTQSSPEPDVSNIRQFVGQCRPPLAFLDFETFCTAIPLFDCVRPYQQVPFQYSIHLMQDDGQLIHHEFLGDGHTDPRPLLVAGLVQALDGAGSIFCYNMSFEKARLEELKLLFPQYETALTKMIDSLVDLIVPFRNKWVYDYRMNGSASIKQVLPALLPHLGYDDLEIKEGGAASQAYLDLGLEKNEDKKRITRYALLEYCKLDTYAMVELWWYLKRIARKELTVVR